MSDATRTDEGTVGLWLPDTDFGARAVVDVAAREYRVVFRARWATRLALLFGAFSAGVVLFGASGVGPTRADAVVVSLAELSVYLVPLAALAMGYGTVVGAAERETLPMLFSLPVSRFRVVVGMFLGRSCALLAALSVGLGVGGAVLAGAVGTAGLAAYIPYLVGALLTGGAFLSIGVAVSAVSSESDRALGGALLAWVWFVLVHDLVAIAAVVAVGLPDWLLTVVVVANPAALFRVVVLGSVSTTGGGIGGTLASAAASPGVAVVGLLAWTVAPVLIAGVAVGRRRVQ